MKDDKPRGLSAGEAPVEQAVTPNPSVLSPTLRVQEGWQTIETAPKDGREILLRRENMVVPAFYGRGRLAANAGASTRFPWVVLDHSNGLNHVREDWASHWMPLPSPPSEHVSSDIGGEDSGVDASSPSGSQAIASGDEGGR